LKPPPPRKEDTAAALQAAANSLLATAAPTQKVYPVIAKAAKQKREWRVARLHPVLAARPRPPPLPPLSFY
jgi:hypothetical protein